MPFVLVILLATGIALPDPVALEVTRDPATVEIRFRLVESLPEEISDALASSAEVRLTYPLRVRAKRRGWWDRRLWSGELVSISTFDAVTGRFRCQVILNGIITASDEAESTEEALRWLTNPPPVRVELPTERRQANLRIRVRAVFSSGTTWLIFPTTDATPWSEIILEPPSRARGRRVAHGRPGPRLESPSPREPVSFRRLPLLDDADHRGLLPAPARPERFPRRAHQPVAALYSLVPRYLADPHPVIRHRSKRRPTRGGVAERDPRRPVSHQAGTDLCRPHFRPRHLYFSHRHQSVAALHRSLVFFPGRGDPSGRLRGHHRNPEGGRGPTLGTGRRRQQRARGRTRTRRASLVFEPCSASIWWRSTTARIWSRR